MTVGQGEGRLLTHRSLDFKKYDFIKKEYEDGKVTDIRMRMQGQTGG